MADLVSKNGRFLGCFQHDRAESPRRSPSPLRQVGVSYEGPSSSIAIGLSKECKWMLKKTGVYHAVVPCGGPF
jgi:hypothetical protein